MLGLNSTCLLSLSTRCPLKVLVFAGLLFLPGSTVTAVDGADPAESSAVRDQETDRSQAPHRRRVRLVTGSHGAPTAVSQDIFLPNCREEPCESVCGDNRCDAEEECLCRFDCPSCAPSPVCGDGLCQSASESSATCPEDCQQRPVCTPSCTAGLCGPDGCGGVCRCPFGELCNSGVCGACASECGVTVLCGRDRCGNQCGSCETNQICRGGVCEFSPACGDGTCSAGESCTSCQTDCGACCGNGRIDQLEYCDGSVGCAFNEICANCSFCGVGVRCGDGRCTSPENNPSSPSYCPSDCAGGGGGGACVCDCDHNGWVNQWECTASCGGQIVGQYCVLPP
jgi:hypothetical protein